MTLSTTEITGSFIDPTTGQPFSNVNVAFQVSQVLYMAGIPVVAPSTPIAAEVSGGQLLSASGSPLELVDQGNTVTLQSGTGFWYWEVAITGDITDGWSFFLPHSATPVDLYSTKNTGTSGTGVTSWDGRTGAVAPEPGDYDAAQVGALAAGTGSTSVPAADLAPKVITLTGTSPAVNAALGNVFEHVLTGNTTYPAPSNPSAGEKIEFHTVQPASGGPYTVTFTTGSAGDYSAGGGSMPAASTAANAVDIFAFVWEASAGGGTGRWCCLNSGGAGY